MRLFPWLSFPLLWCVVSLWESPQCSLQQAATLLLFIQVFEQKGGSISAYSKSCKQPTFAVPNNFYFYHSPLGMSILTVYRLQFTLKFFISELWVHHNNQSCTERAVHWYMAEYLSMRGQIHEYRTKRVFSQDLVDFLRVLQFLQDLQSPLGNHTFGHWESSCQIWA